MESKIRELATKQGIPSPQELSYEARITPQTARKVWEGDLSTRYAETLRKVARALSCSMDDLYIHKAG